MTPLTRKAISELRYHKDYKWIRKCIALSLCMGFSLSGCGKQAETVTDYGTTSDTGENTSGSSARTEEKTEIEKYIPLLAEKTALGLN